LLAKLIRRVWLRGFLPAAMLAAVWGVSIFVHTIGQSRGATPWRWAVTHGVVMVNWGWNTPRTGWGKVGWNLGRLINADGSNWSGVRCVPNLRDPTLQWDIELHPGHVKLPTIYLALAASAPAFAVVWLRRRRVPAGHCPGCRYDLRGVTGGVCPECGREIGGA
jgi:hypothetical protein